MTLLATFKALLFQHTGQTDLVIGGPIAGRNRPEVEGLIGFFVNTLIVRRNLSDNPSFRQLLWRVRETCLGAYAHQEVPYQKLVKLYVPSAVQVADLWLRFFSPFKTYHVSHLKFLA